MHGKSRGGVPCSEYPGPARLSGGGSKCRWVTGWTGLLNDLRGLDVTGGVWLVMHARC